MNTKTEPQLSQRAGRRKNLIVLAGLLAIILIANGVIGLFALNYSNENHLTDLRTLDEISDAMEKARSAQVHFKKQVQEWKNILLRGTNPADLARHRAAFEQEERAMDDELASLSKIAHDLQISIPEINELPRTHAALGSQYRSALQEFHPEQASSALAVDQKVRGIDRAPTDQMDAIVKKIDIRSDELLKNAAQQTVERYHTLRNVLIGGTTAGVIIVLIFLGLSFAALPKD